MSCRKSLTSSETLSCNVKRFYFSNNNLLPIATALQNENQKPPEEVYASIQNSMETMQASLSNIYEAVRDMKSQKTPEVTPFDPRLLLPIRTELQYHEMQKRLDSPEFMDVVVSYMAYIYAYYFQVSILSKESGSDFTKTCKATMAAIVHPKFACIASWNTTAASVKLKNSNIVTAVISKRLSHSN